MYKPIRKADLIKGGTAVKQGEIFTLGFQLFDANGLVIVPTVEQTITVKIANKTGVVFETVATVVGDYIEFTVDENIGAGKMRVELTVADGVNVLQKYPAQGYIELNVTASLDDIGTGTIYTVTAAQMFARIEDSESASASAVETAGNAVVIAEGAVETADAVRADFDLVVAEAGSSNPEVVLARGGEADLKTRLDKTSQQLAETSEQLADITKRKLYYLDAYNSFFGGSANDFVVGQSVTTTTTTAAVSAGATILPLASVVGLSAGVILVVNVGTINQQLVSVVSISGNDVTISPALKASVTSGSNVSPLWTNASHLTTEGLRAWGYWFANAKNADGVKILSGTNPKVTLFGDSWIAQNPAVLASEITNVIPGATVVNKGVSGNTSTQMLARFDTDVPVDSDYVIFNEPGVNDIYQGFTPSQIASNLELLVSKIIAIGAIPVFTGMVPLSEYINPTKIRASELSAQIGDGNQFPSISLKATIIPVIPESKSLGLGDGTLKLVTTGVSNTAVGATALDSLTGGSNNTAIGNDALSAVTTGNNNTGIGVNALRAVAIGGLSTAIGYAALSATTGESHTGIGGYAGLSVTTGVGNTFIGRGAGYQVAGDTTADATTTASYQTCIGYQAGASPTNGMNVAIGYRAKSSGAYATAIGANTSASALGSGALFKDSAGTGASSSVQDEVALGTALHKIKIAGRLNVAQRTPTGSADAQGQVGDITSDDNYLYVKTSTGWKRSALTTW